MSCQEGQSYLSISFLKRVILFLGKSLQIAESVTADLVLFGEYLLVCIQGFVAYWQFFPSRC
jgi:hypothetical protein